MPLAKPIANYIEHRQAFKELLEPKCTQRILLFHGKSGAGKSILLKDFKAIAFSRGFQILPFDLKEKNLSVEEFFRRSLTSLDERKLRGLKTALQSPTPQITLRGIRQEGSNNQINFPQNTDNQTQRHYDLTDAWFNDTKNFKALFFVFIDSYEKAQDDFKSWLNNQFLSRVEHCPALRVVIAGRKLPNYGDIAWEHICVPPRQLQGVIASEHWMPVVEALDRQLPGNTIAEQKKYLEGVCDALKGQPHQIMQMIEGWEPVRE